MWRARAPPIWQGRYNGVVSVVANLRWMRRWETFVFVAALGMGVGRVVQYCSSFSRPGFIVVATEPADATVLIDHVQVEDSSPVMIEERPGRHTVSVTCAGYERKHESVEVVAGRATALKVKLSVSRDTGFELTSDPPGELVWLDEAPMTAPHGQQVRTDFRASAIAPGHHVIEIAGDDRFKAWKQDVEVEPGSIREIHAVLVPENPPAAKR